MRFTCRVPVWLSILTSRANFPFCSSTSRFENPSDCSMEHKDCAREPVFQRLPKVLRSLFPLG